MLALTDDQRELAELAGLAGLTGLTATPGGGTIEIQLNLIGQRILGLPR